MPRMPENDHELLRMVRDMLEAGIRIECEQCSAPFLAHSIQSRYCSQRCRNLASQERRALEAIKAREDHHA